jgi:hypothetical protein
MERERNRSKSGGRSKEKGRNEGIRMKKIATGETDESKRMWPVNELDEAQHSV